MSLEYSPCICVYPPQNPCLQWNSVLYMYQAQPYKTPQPLILTSFDYASFSLLFLPYKLRQYERKHTGTEQTMQNLFI